MKTTVANTNEQALRAAAMAHGESLEDLRRSLGLGMGQLEVKLAAGFSTMEIDMIRKRYRLSAEQMALIFQADDGLADLRRKAETGTRLIRSRHYSFPYDLKASDMVNASRLIEAGDLYEVLLVMYRAGIEAGYRLANNEAERS